MEDVLRIAGGLAVVAIAVGVPLSVLRSLDEIKASQKRLEARMSELETRWPEHETLR